PPDATVSLNGAVLSRGAFRGLFGRDETVELAVTKEGYTEYRETVALTAAEAVMRTVRLDAGSTPAEAPVDPTVDKTVEKPADEGPVLRVVPVSSSRIVALAAGSGTSVVASDAAGKVFALGADGKVLWSAPTGNGSNENSQAVAGAGVVAYAGDRSLAVFDAATGARLWQKALGKGDSGLFGRRPAFVGSLLVMSSDAGIASYEAKTGIAGASFAIAGGSDMSPCCSGGVLYIASKSGVFQAVDAASMAVKASVPTGAVQPVASAPVVSGKRAVFADRRGLVTAIALDSTAIAWQSNLDSAKSVEIFSDPLVTSDSVCVTGKRVLYALSLADGKPRFAPLQGITTQPCEAKGYLWCGAGSTLKQIDPATGKTLAEFALAAAASGRPAFDGKVLFVPLADGSVGMVNLEKLKKS
ncbi:MAG TPA: PQQ-binding-like beta-propeller repeat protein, partial [Treponemataceae bacterium]|nr:PQQ-binding-like beta-propeller repeat protein [Treponemataceae bacterium]